MAKIQVTSTCLSATHNSKPSITTAWIWSK